jgi:copper(I)-binding protein
MKHCRWLLVLSLLAVLALAMPVLGQMDSAVEPNLYFHGMWARSSASVASMQADATQAADATPEAAPMEMGGVSAAYMTIANAGGVGVRLIGASSPVAEVVEIHEMQMDGDVMRMRPVENGIDVLAGNVAVLEPGGLHIMLMNLLEPLMAGQAVPLTLTFATLDNDGNPTDQTMTVEVAAPVADEQPAWTPFAFSLIWARPADAGGTTGAFMSVFNIGDADDALTGVSSEVSSLAEIHETTMANDVMSMRPVEGGVPLAAGGIAAFEPGALHIMLMDLTQPLEAGNAFSLTLTFDSGESVIIGVPVYDRTMMEMSGM